MKVGLCVVSTLKEMEVMVYVLETYDIALEQARELFKGVDMSDVIHEEKTAPNGNRVSSWVFPSLFELVYVQESEVGTKALPID